MTETSTFILARCTDFKLGGAIQPRWLRLFGLSSVIGMRSIITGGRAIQQQSLLPLHGKSVWWMAFGTARSTPCARRTSLRSGSCSGSFKKRLVEQIVMALVEARWVPQKRCTCCPHFLPLWDGDIADLYRCDHDAFGYARFCQLMKQLAVTVQAYLTKPDDRSILKRIDEYNWAITRRRRAS